MQWTLLLLMWMDQCCPVVSQLYQFHYINEEKTWTEAQQYCREKHTDLVTVTNMKDMKRLINMSAGDQSEAWIGLYYQTDGDRKWHWSQDELILIKENKTWEDALTYCRDHHHDLVTITNMEDQISVQQEAQFASTDYVWMGLSYACTLDLWFWVSDDVVSYPNWASNEPMDDCDMSGAMETGGKHKWRKKRDSEKFNFICSK
ncbi:snaclec stejaggregin-B subunit beta-1-like [Poecilia formosa]|uniref:snaclec stejaggregin-B subunit beta-1-like n=1 Tax=Poecilia formosa TaxID=48698 RepID=UPI0007B80053|nr:PREDICTED: snaclec stejaggregin-B subunit beta-1-like [Poecilia formosa]